MVSSKFFFFSFLLVTGFVLELIHCIGSRLYFDILQRCETVSYRIAETVTKQFIVILEIMFTLR